MISFRKLLFPFSVVYDAVTQLRNIAFDQSWKEQISFDIPIICVGNLSVGGTGKTPQIEYLIRLLEPQFRVVTLSRGYKRKTTGFYLADKTSRMEDIGDEPYQYFTKFKDIYVAVDTDRVNGVRQIMKKLPQTEVVLLDDAYQHRHIKAGFTILLTKYNDLYMDDLLLPAGNLRESKKGASRADVIIVTKCPPNLSSDAQEKIANKLSILKHQQLFFTSISYDKYIYNGIEPIELQEIDREAFIAVAGIAKPHYFYDHLKISRTKTITFPDHHHFSETDIQKIILKANGKKIITTEKDFMRLKGKIHPDQLYYLPIETTFINDHSLFDNTILNFVRQSI